MNPASPPVGYTCVTGQTLEQTGPLERLQLALDAGAIIGTWVWSIPDDHFTADERFARAFGLSIAHCVSGLPLRQVNESIHPEDVLRVEEATAAALARRSAYRCEYRVRHSDGLYRWIEARGRVEVDEQGRPVRFPGVLIDIEARRLAEAERDRATALLHVFAAAVPGVVYAKDRAGRMLVANQGTTELIGKPPGYYLGKTDGEFLDDPEQAKVIMATDRRIMEAGVTEQIEEQVTLPDGSVGVWLSTKAPLRDQTGAIIGLIGSSIDVTDRKHAELAIREQKLQLEHRVKEVIAEREQAEEALRHSQKMEAIGQLTGGIAHDFNNLLMGISGSLELMRARLSQGRLADLDRYLTVALGVTQRASALTHRLLTFARRQPLSPRLTNIDALVDGIVELIRRTVGPNITINVLAGAGHMAACIDAGQLENALLNLCINARDAIAGPGSITLQTSLKAIEGAEATLLEVPAGRYIELKVTDTGSGMSPATAAKAFEPFFTTKPIGEGTGLGLSMVYGFARQSGGQVKITSAEGRGTTITLYLPHAAAEDREQPASITLAHAPRAVGEGIVLIVDDEPAVRMLVTEVLQDLGYTPIEATDSAAGLRILQSDVHIDLVVTDVGLPGGMTGCEMVERCRPGRQGLKVLFMTGYADIHALGHYEADPAAQVLVKPFALETLVARVSALLTGAT